MFSLPEINDELAVVLIYEKWIKVHRENTINNKPESVNSLQTSSKILKAGLYFLYTQATFFWDESTEDVSLHPTKEENKIL